MLLLFVISIQTFAIEILNREIHISRTFAESTSTAGFYTKEPLPECLWGLMYINLASDSGKAIFTMALTAKTANQPVVRIDYVKESNGTCSVRGFHTM